MKLKNLTIAMLLSTVPTAGAFAAAMDRSGQSIAAFLQPGNYFEAGISALDPNVSGVDITGRNTGGMAEDYYFPAAALKLQINEQFSFGLLYDQPFGAKAKYSGDNLFVANASDNVLGLIGTDQLQGMAGNKAITGGTEVEVDTQNLSMIFGYQPTENWNVFAGGVYQTVKGNVKLRGQAYSLYNGYDANIKETGGGGWLVGAAYQIPEIALKASITYRSEVDHKVNINEDMALLNSLEKIDGPGLAGLAGAAYPLVKGAILANNSDGKTTITTPQSVNIDLQSGIMADTVAFANVRWVNWKDFSIQPYKFGAVSEVVGNAPGINRPNGFNLVEYSKDQWSITTGLGRKFNEQWAGNVSVGWDSGAGNPVTTLGPTEGFWNLGVGMQFSPTPQTFIAGGVKYFWLGDAKAQTGAQAGDDTYVADFKDNHAIAYGLKMGYRF